jgi:hypothetical protein
MFLFVNGGGHLENINGRGGGAFQIVTKKYKFFIGFAWNFMRKLNHANQLIHAL